MTMQKHQKCPECTGILCGDEKCKGQLHEYDDGSCGDPECCGGSGYGYICMDCGEYEW